MAIRKLNGKFEGSPKVAANLFAGKPRLEDIKTGECDFHIAPAVHGRMLGKDVFYLCERCKESVMRAEVG